MRQSGSRFRGHFVGETSAVGQPARPTRPSILPGSANGLSG